MWRVPRIALGFVLVLTPLAVVPRAADQAVKTEKVSGYAEWRHGSAIIVDGQRVVSAAATTYKNKNVKSFDAIGIGFEVSAEGTRQADGSVLAKSIDAKPAGTSMFAGEIQSATNEMEAKWLRSGAVTEDDDEVEGQEKVVGKILEGGPAVNRVNRILDRVRPSYVSADALRLHVVQTPVWNAMAMGNGAVWVFTGLLNDMDDDEVAIVVGHELAHYTHQHTAKEFKKAMVLQLIALGATAATEVATKNEKATKVVALASLFTVMTIKNGYSRGEEDQADRVGVRYAYEGGFNVCKAPGLWQRFADKYGDENKVMNFFLGDHSQSSARIRNMQQQIGYNYRQCLAR